MNIDGQGVLCYTNEAFMEAYDKDGNWYFTLDSFSPVAIIKVMSDRKPTILPSEPTKPSKPGTGGSSSSSSTTKNPGSSTQQEMTTQLGTTEQSGTTVQLSSSEKTSPKTLLFDHAGMYLRFFMIIHAHQD